MLEIIPNKIQNTNRDVPPELINGSGTPVTGNNLMVVAILIKVCNANQVAAPINIYLPK